MRAAAVLCVACAARPKTLLACLPRLGELPLLLLPGWLAGWLACPLLLLLLPTGG